MHHPVPFGEDHHLQDDPHAGGRRGVQAGALYHHPDAPQQGPHAGQEEVRQGDADAGGPGQPQGRRAQDQHVGVRAAPLRQGPPGAGR